MELNDYAYSMIWIIARGNRHVFRKILRDVIRKGDNFLFVAPRGKSPTENIGKENTLIIPLTYRSN